MKQINPYPIIFFLHCHLALARGGGKFGVSVQTLTSKLK